jgi:hypothetical protein
MEKLKFGHGLDKLEHHATAKAGRSAESAKEAAITADIGSYFQLGHWKNLALYRATADFSDRRQRRSHALSSSRFRFKRLPIE